MYNTAGVSLDQGLPNYDPRAKYGPPRHFVRFTKIFCQQWKIMYLQNMYWFRRM